MVSFLCDSGNFACKEVDCGNQLLPAIGFPLTAECWALSSDSVHATANSCHYQIFKLHGARRKTLKGLAFSAWCMGTGTCVVIVVGLRLLHLHCFVLYEYVLGIWRVLRSWAKHGRKSLRRLWYLPNSTHIYLQLVVCNCTDRCWDLSSHYSIPPLSNEPNIVSFCILLWSILCTNEARFGAWCYTLLPLYIE